MWLYCSIVVIGYGFYLYQLFFPAPDFLRTAAMYSSVSLQHINISFLLAQFCIVFFTMRKLRNEVAYEKNYWANCCRSNDAFC